MSTPAPPSDLYAILGVPRDATQALIDQAYRALVRRYHPTAAAVGRRAGRGVDVVKVMVSGGNITPGSLPWQSLFDEAALRVLVDGAHGAGIPVAAHAHGADALRACVAAGVDAVEHCTFMTADGVDDDPTLLRDLAESGIVVRITPGSVPGGPPPPPAPAPRA